MSTKTEVSPYEEEGFAFIDPSTIKQEEAEGFKEKVKRHSLRSLARSGEALIGLPGDVLEFAQGLVTQGFGAAMGDQEKASEISEIVSNFLPKIPSSRDIRETVTQGISKDYLEPKSRGEESSDEVVSDLATLLIPVKGRIPFARAIAGALGGAATKEGIKELGGGETSQVLGKMGAMFLTGNIGRRSAKRYVSNLHQEATALIPEGATMSSRNLGRGVDEARRSLQVGGVTPDKSHSLNLMNQLLRKIRTGGETISPHEVKGFRQSVNELRFDRKLSPKAKFYLDRFDNVLNDSLLEYGRENPAFLNRYREANLGTAGLKQSNKLAKSISKKVDITKLSPEALILLGVHNVLKPSLLGKLGVSAAGAMGATAIKRLATNKTLRTHYLNTIRSAASENWKAFPRNLNMLENELSKDSDEKDVEIFDFTEDSS